MIKIDKAELQQKIINVLQTAHVVPEHAHIIADVLVDADACGIHSHGTIRLEHYINRITAGGINLHAKFPIQAGRFPWASCIDAQGGFGHVAANKAVIQGKKIVEQNGIAIVSIKNTSHCGALGYYAKQATKENLICFITLNTDKCVTPFGGKDSFFGTNPMAWGFPQTDKDRPIIADMSTSEKSLGAIFAAKDENKKIPLHWAVDKKGVPTDDPLLVHSLLPMAQHKGYTLAFVVETLSALLTNSAFGPHVSPMYNALDKTRNASAFFLFFTPSLYQDDNVFTKNITQMINELHTQTTAPGFEKILVPGEKEHSKKKISENEGISIFENVYNFLAQV